MSSNLNNDGFVIAWRFRRHAETRKGRGHAAPKPRSTTPSLHRVHVKVRHVQQGSRRALLWHANYILDRDKYQTREKSQETVEEFGDVVDLAREIGGNGNHYRIIIAPRRGDMLDMSSLVTNTVARVQELEGMKFKWAGVIHEMKEPNIVGVYNHHAHLIVEGGFGGASMFKREFREAARAEATRQIDRMKVIGLEKHKTHEISKEMYLGMDTIK